MRQRRRAGEGPLVLSCPTPNLRLGRFAMVTKTLRQLLVKKILRSHRHVFRAVKEDLLRAKYSFPWRSKALRVHDSAVRSHMHDIHPRSSRKSTLSYSLSSASQRLLRQPIVGLLIVVLSGIICGRMTLPYWCESSCKDKRSRKILIVRAGPSPETRRAPLPAFHASTRIWFSRKAPTFGK